MSYESNDDEFGSFRGRVTEHPQRYCLFCKVMGSITLYLVREYGRTRA